MKVALVTGGSRGIGRGITRRLLADGYAVSVLATRPAPPELLVDLRAGLDDPGRVRYLQGDVVDPTTHARYLDDAADAWGRLDLLVNNAGVAPAERTDLLAATPESFDRVLGINLKGPYFLTQAFANRVLALTPEWAGDAPRATVVNVSSISATAVSTNRGEYCVSKAGVAMATQLFAVRLDGWGARALRRTVRRRAGPDAPLGAAGGCRRRRVDAGIGQHALLDRRGLPRRRRDAHPGPVTGPTSVGARPTRPTQD
jgi:NAD(P)-dependent dehydrogenase (short-subunit alcohol dehydrogenase family)